MRAIGMTPAQVARTVVIESLWVAVWGAAMGVAGGLVVEKFPIAMNFLRITGYVLPFTVPWTMIGIAVVSALAIGIVASWVPARRAARLNVLEAVGYE
jgi:putative ABC transport system permease protein